jgi:hypothetical protein
MNASNGATIAQGTDMSGGLIVPGGQEGSLLLHQLSLGPDGLGSPSTPRTNDTSSSP